MNLRRLGGPGSRRRRQHTVRAWAEYVDGSRVRYHYPCGHSRVKTMMQRAPGNRRIPMNPVMVRKLARYWSRENGGVAVPLCPTCRRNERRSS